MLSLYDTFYTNIQGLSNNRSGNACTPYTYSELRFINNNFYDFFRTFILISSTANE